MEWGFSSLFLIELCAVLTQPNLSQILKTRSSHSTILPLEECSTTSSKFSVILDVWEQNSRNSWHQLSLRHAGGRHILSGCPGPRVHPCTHAAFLRGPPWQPFPSPFSSSLHGRRGRAELSRAQTAFHHFSRLHLSHVKPLPTRLGPVNNYHKFTCLTSFPIIQVWSVVGIFTWINVILWHGHDTLQLPAPATNK